MDCTDLSSVFHVSASFDCYAVLVSCWFALLGYFVFQIHSVILACCCRFVFCAAFKSSCALFSQFPPFAAPFCAKCFSEDWEGNNGRKRLPNSRLSSVGSCCVMKAGCVSERKKNSSDSLLRSRSKPVTVWSTSRKTHCRHEEYKKRYIPALTNLVICISVAIFDGVALPESAEHEAMSYDCCAVLASVKLNIILLPLRRSYV